MRRSRCCAIKTARPAGRRRRRRPTGLPFQHSRRPAHPGHSRVRAAHRPPRSKPSPDVIRNLTTDGVSGVADRRPGAQSAAHGHQPQSHVQGRVDGRHRNPPRLDGRERDRIAEPHSLDQVHRAAERNAADDSTDSAHAHRGAGRDHAERSAAERSRHHDAGRRRRRRVEHDRRHVQHARVHRQQQPVRRWRARRRAGRRATSTTSNRSRCFPGRPAPTWAGPTPPATST